METRVVPDNQEPSLSDLLRSILAEAKEFMKAEVDLTKADLKSTLKMAAFALVVFTAGGVLLAFALSMIAAAIVLAAHGNAVQALLAAAAVDLIVAGSAIIWLLLRLRSPSSTDANTHAGVRSVPTQSGSEMS
jgi:Putative Actinobacterial Holin-X, holin superfamily III